MPKIVLGIPQDVVREIFSHLSSILDVQRPREFPWHLGHICAAWRATFLSMQLEFWNSVKLEWPPLRQKGRDGFPPSLLPRYTRRVMEMLQFFLRCNRGSPFSFTLCTQYRAYSEKHAQEVMRVLLILVQESSRWQNASMNLQSSMLPMLYHIKHRLPVLQSLNLALRPDNPTPVPELYADIFESAPLLASIAIVTSLSTWRFNWSFLTFIHLSDSLALETGSSFYDVLPHTVRLEGLQIGMTIIHRFNVIDSLPLPVIKLPYLKHLWIHSCRLLTMLEAPALVDFQISSKPLEQTPDVVIDFLRRSSCRLHHLCIKRYDTLAMTRILQHSPDTRRLCILSSELSGIFNWLSSEKSRAPDLEALYVFGRLRRIENEEIELDSLLHLVRARARTSIDGKGLKQLAIHEHEVTEAPQLNRRLRTLCHDLGVDLQDPVQCHFCASGPDYHWNETGRG
ncbi:hypothetical protein APHAL10511_003251 [Amanita phalloides]|nr:hypothetical protein APHAL10511_003251 [Amanita phalloides]